MISLKTVNYFVWKVSLDLLLIEESEPEKLKYMDVLRHYPILVTFMMAFTMNLCFTFYNFLAVIDSIELSIRQSFSKNNTERPQVTLGIIFSVLLLFTQFSLYWQLSSKSEKHW
jgi:hypothetical protein